MHITDKSKYPRGETMSKKILLILLFILSISILSCGNTSTEITDSNTNKDNTDKSTIVTTLEISELRIGNQVWTAYNYHPDLFPSHVSSGISYENNTAYSDTYGMLLTYDEAVLSCPEGWHIPTLAEWQVLFDYLGGNNIAGGKLKSESMWDSPNLGELNDSGFNALPAGGASMNHQFDGLGWSAHFWSATADEGLFYVPTLFNDSTAVNIISISGQMYASVRYIKDSI